MAKKKKKESKPRAEKYEDKLSIDGTFEEVFKVIKKNKEEKTEKNKKKS